MPNSPLLSAGVPYRFLLAMWMNRISGTARHAAEVNRGRGQPPMPRRKES